MRRKWILIGLAAGLLAALVGGGTALAWGGGGHGWGWSWGRGDHDERQAAVAAKVAETLGTDEQETADAIAQAQLEVREESADAALEDLADRVAETLGTDADETADAIDKISREMFTEALEERLQSAIGDGRITEEQAQEYRDRDDSYQGWYGFGNSFKGFRVGDSDEFADRVADEIDVESGDVQDAISQALSDIRRESLEGTLQEAVDDGRITQERADEILEDYDSGDGRWFNKGGHHGRHGFGSRGDGRRGFKGHWGRGHGFGGKRGSGSQATPTPAPASDGDAT